MGMSQIAYVPISDVKTVDASQLRNQIEKDIEEYKKIAHPGVSEQLDIQLATLRSSDSPEFEFMVVPGFSTMNAQPEPGKMYTTIGCFLVHPLSRGSVHAETNNPLDNPILDPCYFERASDLETLLQGFKYVMLLSRTEPLKSGIVKELEATNCTTDEELREYLKERIGIAGHGIGTCSMLPRDKQGVVDSKLKVYGTRNLRVVDISVLSLHVAAHPQTFAYFIAEKAYDIIRAAHK